MVMLTHVGAVVLSIICFVSFTHASTIPTVDHISCRIGGPCPFGRVCAGNSFKKRCVKPMPLMGFCKGDPFWVCDKGLECQHGICMPPMGTKGDRCDFPGAECGPGMVCAGNARVKKCVKPMPEGGFCRGDPYWVCAEGLECRDRVCQKPMGQKGERCDKPGVICMPGSVCAGTSKVKKCVKPMPEGGFCKGDPYWVCGSGLVCKDRVCVKGDGERPPTKPHTPAKKPKKMRIRCDRPGVICPAGTLCVGNMVKRCVMPMKEGQECRGDPFWLCEPGLNCVDRVCVKPGVNPVAKPGGRCEEKTCPRGEVCAGIAVKRCIVPMGPGGECRNDPFWICEASLFCKDNVCTYMVEEGGRCEKKGAMCVSGTVCVGRRFKKKCKKPMELGGICSKDPFWVCATGLKCQGGICVGA